MGRGIFLTVKDLMILTGSLNYSSSANIHKGIRSAIAHQKRKLTIKEYCEYEKIDFEYIWNCLRR